MEFKAGRKKNKNSRTDPKAYPATDPKAQGFLC